jgi:DNA-binding transcriptional LysR family regulator
MHTLAYVLHLGLKSLAIRSHAEAIAPSTAGTTRCVNIGHSECEYRLQGVTFLANLKNKPLNIAMDTGSGADKHSPLTTDRLDLLRLFICTAEYGKVSAAAQMLGLSQPSASRLLRRLEVIIDARLLNRTQQGVTLTQTGEEFLVASRRLLQEWERAVNATKTYQQAVTGHIRIAAPVAVGQSMLAILVARFVCLHPQVTVDLEVSENSSLDPSLYDLWFRVGNLTQDHFIVRPVGYTRRALICAAALEKVKHPRDLESRPAVRISSAVPKAIELTNADGETFTLKQRCIFTTDNLYAACEAVREGVGYAVLPLWAVQSDLDRGLLAQVCPAWTPPPLVLSLSYLPDDKRPARVSALFDFLRTELMQRDEAAVNFFSNLGAKESVGRTHDEWFSRRKDRRTD